MADNTTHRLPANKATNCLFSLVFGANLVMSVLNTLLLSFIVKSVQLNNHGFFNGKLSWDRGQSTTMLGLPAILGEGKSISVNSIESYDDQPLFIKTNQPLMDKNMANDRMEVKQVTQQEILSASDLLESRRQQGTLLISTGPLASSSSGDSVVESNHLIVHTGDGSHLDEPNLDQSVVGGRRAKQPPVEIVTKSLVLNLIDNDNNSPNSNQAPINSQNNKQTKRVNHKQTRLVGSQTGATAIRRLLEFDGEEQSITLPLLNQLSTTRTLMVDEDLNGGPEITGTIGDNLDLQARNGDLTCRSSETLKLVSKSGRVRLIAGQRLTLTAPVINLSSLSKKGTNSNNNQLYILHGIKYLTEIKENTHTTGELDAQSGSGTNLRAYRLVLVDGHLRASSE